MRRTILETEGLETEGEDDAGGKKGASEQLSNLREGNHGKRRLGKSNFCFLLAAILSASAALGALIAKSSSWALEPPRAGEVERLRASGELESRIKSAKRIGNHKIDDYRLKKAISKARRMMLRSRGKTNAEIDGLAGPLSPPPTAWHGMPTKGVVKAFALLIEFSDCLHINSREYIQDNLFGAGDAARSPYESLATYYDRSSYQQLDLSNGTALDWYKTAYERSAVPLTDAGREGLIKEALDYFAGMGHDFSQYDNDGDGVIDYFIVIWAGPDNGWANFWWGQMLTFSDDTYTVGGKSLYNYSWQWEANPAGGTFTPVTVIHETGHALGLPDYYDYDDYDGGGEDEGPPGGVGGLDMMDHNMGDHNCCSKWVLDWISPQPIAGGTCNVTLNASGTSQDAVLIWPGADIDDPFNEFYMVQNRLRVGNDNAPGMPGDGMLIWHVDASLDSQTGNFLYDNSYTVHKLLRLMEADGLEEIETGDHMADSGDYYRSGYAFGPRTAPPSKKYDGTESGVWVHDISDPGTQISATFSVSRVMRRWVRRYNGPGNGSDQAHGLAVDGQGNVYVTGESDGAGSSRDYATIKYSPSGEELWAARYNGPGNGIDVAEGLFVDSQGNVYVTGYSMGNGSDYDYFTIKYSQ